MINKIFNPVTLTGALFYGALVLVVAFLLGKALHFAVRRYLLKADAAGTDSTSVRFLAELANIIVYIVAFIFYAYLIPALSSLGTAWLASVGFLSVIIGLATQSTLSNLIAGISLILYKPFHIGDRLQVLAPTGTEIATVESIDLGYTSLRTPDGRRIVLANSVIATQTNINFSQHLPHMLWEVAVTVSEGKDIPQVRKIFIDVAKTIPKIEKINGCFVSSLTGLGTVITLSTMCLDHGDIAQIKSDLLEQVKKELDEAGIKLA